jgi:hypothetical protein
MSPICRRIWGTADCALPAVILPSARKRETYFIVMRGSNATHWM